MSEQTEALRRWGNGKVINAWEDTPKKDNITNTIPEVPQVTAILATSADYAMGYAEGFNDACKNPEQEPVVGLHAVYFRNNWDGEGDLEYVLAHLSEKGEWALHENGAPLLEFEGDEIIKTWPLTFEIAAPQPAQQEPVTHQYQNRSGEWHNFLDPKHYEATVKEGSWPIRALYTSPPAQPKPLTDEQIADATGVYPTTQPDKWHEAVEIARAIEAKLKEKNT